jgi:hypothetical protein
VLVVPVGAGCVTTASSRVVVEVVVVVGVSQEVRIRVKTARTGARMISFFIVAG